jgi:preprotein translocase subunit SecG
VSTTDNPYSPPAASLDGSAGQSSSSAVPASVIALLAETRPWVRLLAVMFFIFIGIAIVAMLIVSAVAPAAAAGNPVAGAPGIIAMIVMGALYVPPTLFMWRYASGIRRLQDGGGMGALEEALSSQKSFWKYIGVLTLVMICLYGIFIVGAIVLGLMAAKGH